MADDPFDRFILDFLARLPPEQLRVAADITKRAENNAAHQRRWVQELVIAVDAFARFGLRAPWATDRDLIPHRARRPSGPG